MLSLPPARAAALLLLLFLAGVLHPQSSGSTDPKPVETLQFAIEWRLVRAGTALLSRTAMANSGWRSDLHLESAGLVNKLYRVNDDYRSTFDSAHCISNLTLHAEEGARRRDTTVSFYRDTRKSSYLEKDLLTNKVVTQKELDTPPCVHDIVAALVHLRGLKLQPGQSVTLPLSDGKRMVNARIEAQERETVKTTSGTYKTIRYEAFLFNDVLYSRKGRLLIWLSEDTKSLPVQVRVRLNFPVGTISLQLEKVF